MTENQNPCPPGVLPTCIPKECGVEICPFRELYALKELASVHGGWGEYARMIREKSQAKKEVSKTKKQRRDEAGRGQ